MELTLAPRRLLRDPYRRKLFLSVFCLLMTFIFLRHPHHEGDTRVLLRSISEIRACVESGSMIKCSPQSPFSLYQFIPALPLALLGLPERVILHFLAYLNFFSLLGCAVLTRKVLRRRSHAMGTLGILILVTSPLLWYAHSTFGELLAAFLILSFVASILLKAPTWMIASCFIAAGSTKDIAFAFLLPLGFFCASKLRNKELYQVLPVAALSVCGINGIFNYLRYGSILNQYYLNPLFVTRSIEDQLSSFFGLWLSPSGGLLFFWPTFCALFLTCGTLALRKKVPWQPAAVISAILFALTLGFSKWFAPFGWIAWGPRLLLPWLPALSLICLYFYFDPIESALLSRLAHRRSFICGAFVAAILSLPQFVILFRQDVMDRIFQPSAGCSVQPIIEQDAPYYFHCLRSVVWPAQFPVAELYLPFSFSHPTAWISLLSLAYLVALAIGLTRMKEQLMRQRNGA